MKAYVEIGDMINSIFKFLKSENYSTMVEAINGTTKEDGFRGAMFIFPSIMLHYCDVIYTKDKEDKNEQD